jgi:hypothetical protein
MSPPIASASPSLANEARNILAAVTARASAVREASAGGGRVLYVPDDHGLLSEVEHNHLDWPTHLARIRV